MTQPSIFISSSKEGLPLCHEIASQLQSIATPIVWSDGVFMPGMTPIQSLTEAVDRADFAIVFLTTDRSTRHRAGLTDKRDNVIFELGFLVGRLGMSRTLLVVEGSDTALPSDLAGVLHIGLPKSAAAKVSELVAPAVAHIKSWVFAEGPKPTVAPAFYSCFISYSWNDKEFSVQLHDDLEKVGVNCWLDARQMKVGHNISDQIGRAIQAHDKLLLVLSKASVRSDWVQQEISKALELERTRQKTVLFPVRLDDAVLSTRAKGFAQLKNRLIIDFHNWRDRREYQRAFSRLVRDLAISASVESSGGA